MALQLPPIRANGINTKRTGQFPALDKMTMGGRPNTPQSDALGRYTQKIDESRANSGLIRPVSEGANPRGGMPAMRGPQAMVPYLRRAAKEMGLPPTAVTPAVLAQIKALGTVPQQMARTFGTADPLAQARMLLRKRQ